MHAPDCGAARDLLPDVSAAELLEVLAVAAEPLVASDLRVYLSDFQGVALQLAMPAGEVDEDVVRADVKGAMAGRAFRTGARVVAMAMRIGELVERAGTSVKTTRRRIG